MVACSGGSDDDGRIGVVQAVAPMLGFKVWGGGLVASGCRVGQEEGEGQ
jgi:hypothetical protein